MEMTVSATANPGKLCKTTYRPEATNAMAITKPRVIPTKNSNERCMPYAAPLAASARVAGPGLASKAIAARVKVNVVW